ncbi:hypothetical protein [Streptomyces beigongshangae]|uniref:hypothetical protein n=1 Tax=Streptomyces beigongshangae TaxID=2841597 RepID=UPI001C857D98|nr:hypothetical protein [Streptomyces sp. REN17]
MNKSYTWISGEGEREPGDLNPRGWGRVDFKRSRDAHHGPDESETKAQERHEVKIVRRLQSASPTLAPLCCSILVPDLPRRISTLSELFDTVTAKVAKLHRTHWLETFTADLANVKIAECEEWEGALIWGAAKRSDFATYCAAWENAAMDLAKHAPNPRYPSQEKAGSHAPFIDVALGSSLGFYWVLHLNWNTLFSAAIVNSIAFWADMASGVDAPDGALAEIFDALPSLVEACATRRHDNLSPTKALAIEYLRTPMIPVLAGPRPSLEDVWLSRLADVGARESCVLMTGCPSAFRSYRSSEDTRCLVAWGIIHDLYDLPRDLINGNRINGVLWALYSGFSAGDILAWLRDSVAIASQAESCAAKLLLCTAFVHVSNPRWATNVISLKGVAKRPTAPKFKVQTGEALPLFTARNEGQCTADSRDIMKAQACHCANSSASRALGIAVSDALRGAVPGFASSSDQLEAHNMGLSFLIAEDWDSLITLSRTAWSTFLKDLESIADWVDRK